MSEKVFSDVFFFQDVPYDMLASEGQVVGLILRAINQNRTPYGFFSRKLEDMTENVSFKASAMH